LDLSVIIVNYKSPELILECLKSVYAETKEISFEIIIVDNDSQDSSRQQIEEKYPDVQWIQMAYNSGFSRANNTGMKRAAGKYVLLLNSDTIILDGTLDKVIEQMSSETDVAAASVQLLNADNSFQNAGNYFVIGGLNILLTLPVLNSVFRQAGTVMKVKKPSIQSSDKTNYVDWISGAFMLVKKDAMDKAGMLDEDFFLFSEEIEWCSRLRKVGKIAVYINLRVIHLEGGTTKKLQVQKTHNYFEYWTPKGKQLLLSHLLRIRKQYSVVWFLINYVFFVLEIPVLFIAGLFSGKYSLRRAKIYAVNVFSLLAFFPKIIFRKPFFYKVM
jgi:GT2 family glycosyltransferase